MYKLYCYKLPKAAWVNYKDNGYTTYRLARLLAQLSAKSPGIMQNRR